MITVIAGVRGNGAQTIELGTFQVLDHAGGRVALLLSRGCICALIAFNVLVPVCKCTEGHRRLLIDICSSFEHRPKILLYSLTHVALSAELLSLPVKGSYDLHGLVDGSSEFAALSLPTFYPVNFCITSPHFRIDLVAQFAFCSSGNSFHNQLHSACLSYTIFLCTMLPKMPPFLVTTRKVVLIEEAHRLS